MNTALFAFCLLFSYQTMASETAEGGDRGAKPQQGVLNWLDQHYCAPDIFSMTYFFGGFKELRDQMEGTTMCDDGCRSLHERLRKYLDGIKQEGVCEVFLPTIDGDLPEVAVPHFEARMIAEHIARVLRDGKEFPKEIQECEMTKISRNLFQCNRGSRYVYRWCDHVVWLGSLTNWVKPRKSGYETYLDYLKKAGVSEEEVIKRGTFEVCDAKQKQ